LERELLVSYWQENAMPKRYFFIALFVLGSIAQAQQSPSFPRGEVFAGYAFLHAKIPFATDPDAGITTVNLNGWNASVALNPTAFLGVVGDFGGYYGPVTNTELFKPNNGVLCTGNVNATLRNIHTVTFGPQLALRQEHFTVFAHGLLGIAHIRADFSGVTPAATVSDNKFAMLFGGGADIDLSRRFAFRVQPDYMRTEVLSREQNNFRFSAGWS
jgi:opacity protein-like surface antigen